MKLSCIDGACDQVNITSNHNDTSFILDEKFRDAPDAQHSLLPNPLVTPDPCRMNSILQKEMSFYDKNSGCDFFFASKMIPSIGVGISYITGKLSRKKNH